ncbi:MAG: PSD1 and planctomycete cytochrome C domain-containing protein [Planctomycetota bacterium]
MIRISLTLQVALLGTLWTGVFLQAKDPDSEGIEFFERKIRPILVEHCYECHSAEAMQENDLQGGLYLDTRSGIRAGGESGPAVVPGKIKDSLLINSLKQEDFEMPPEGRLPDEVIADFEKWIEMGAPDPRDGEAMPKSETNYPEADNHWAFQQPERSTAPPVRQNAWAQSAIDPFVLAKLEAKEMAPVASAEPRVLVRRMYFDLLGLPPTPEQVEQFVAAASQDRQKSVTELIDQLLQSKHYGERWGRHWLDVARYAEDQAHTFSVRNRDSAFRYRDWVIAAFNDDMPFNQFVQLQLAGDLMEHDDRFTRLAGMGFLGLGAQYYKNSDKAKAVADELDDAIDTLTRGFLGLTVSCARCHDHKFDPIPTTDYYALAGIFNGRSYSDAPLVDDSVVMEYNEAQKLVNDKNNEIRNWLKEIGVRAGQERFAEIAKYFLVAWKMSVLKANGISLKDEDIAEQEKLHPYYVKRFREFMSNKGEALKRLPELESWFSQDQSQPDLKVLEQKDVSALDKVLVPSVITELALQMQESAQRIFAKDLRLENEYQQAIAGTEEESERKKIKRQKLEKDEERILRNFLRDGRGPLFANEGESEKHFLSETEKNQLTESREEVKALQAASPPKYPVAHVIRGGGNTMNVYIRGNPSNQGPIVAKSFLERFSETPRPTEPEQAKKQAYTRLDLASDIVADENPLTARVIVNRVWQWHFGKGLVGTSSNFGIAGESPSHPHLLDDLTVRFIEHGWSIKWLHREIMSSATYQLSSEINPENLESDAVNQFLWRFTRRRLDVEAWRDSLLAVSGELDLTTGGPTFKLDSNSRRRTVYAKISRHELSGLLRMFDFPDANVSAAKRTETTVPQQQLFVLNSPFFIAQAKAFAKRLDEAELEDGGRVELAYQLAFGRSASKDESEIAERFFAMAQDKEDRLSRWEQYAQALLATNEFLYID